MDDESADDDTWVVRWSWRRDESLYISVVSNWYL